MQLSQSDYNLNQDRQPAQENEGTPDECPPGWQVVEDEHGDYLRNYEECYDVASHQSSEIKLHAALVDQQSIKTQCGDTRHQQGPPRADQSLP